MTRRTMTLLAMPLLALTLAGAAPAAASRAATPSASTRDAADLADYARRARMAKAIGATQMSVTDGLPLATWELDPGDPYPAWFVHHATLFKIFPPRAVQPFVDMTYAARVQRIVAARCAALGREGLTAVWYANEPAVLPEPFFAAHPQLRGARIDHPARSRKVHYAPNVDRPETLAMYRESVRTALSVCPQIETFSWVTTDAGSGFDWVPALYSGANGADDVRGRPLADRVAGFMMAIQQAAKEDGHDIRIAINQIEPRQWMIPSFGPDVLENIVRKLPRGLAVNGREGPDGRPFDTGGGRSAWGGAFYPVIGIVAPSFDPVAARPSPRLTAMLGDGAGLDMTYRLLLGTRDRDMSTLGKRMAALRDVAASEVGEAHADDLVAAWAALGDVRAYLGVLDFGGMLRFGHVLNRWITRPMVPFPLELTAEEKADYRPFLLQAKGEEQATDLVDIQAMREYEGWGARLLFQRTIELATPRAERALAILAGLADAATDPARRAEWTLMRKRVQALIYLMRSADDMVSYQAQLDRVTTLGAKPEADPVLGAQGGWDRADMIDLARREIDTMVALRTLLSDGGDAILDLAPTAGEETIMRLGPALTRQIDHKIAVMNAHWRDYDRLFTVPNP